MKKLNWIVSYETIKFDTIDGDIHRDQYAIYKGKYIIREHPENNNQFLIIDPQEDTTIVNKIKSFTKVNVLEEEKMYYDEYILPDGRKYREKSDVTRYKSFSNNIILEKNVTDKDIEEIKKDDYKWK